MQCKQFYVYAIIFKIRAWINTEMQGYSGTICIKNLEIKLIN